MTIQSLTDVAQTKDALVDNVNVEDAADPPPGVDVRNLYNVQGCNDLIIQVTKKFTESITIIFSDSLTENGTYVELDRKTLDGGFDDSVIFQHIGTLHFVQISYENPPLEGEVEISLRAKEIV